MRSRVLLPFLMLSVVAALAACKPKDEAPAAAGSEDEKAFYALGALVSEYVKHFDLTDAELAQVQKGFADSIRKKKLEVENPMDQRVRLQEIEKERVAKAEEKAAADNDKLAAESAAYLEKAAAAPGAVKTDSGVVITELKAGTGAMPKSTDKVKVHYHGTLPDGTVFDSSVERNNPSEFDLDGVIPCWTEALQRIKVGGKARLVCPSSLAYGDRGRPPHIRPNAALVFEVELLDIVKE